MVANDLFNIKVGHNSYTVSEKNWKFNYSTNRIHCPIGSARQRGEPARAQTVNI